MPHASTSTQAAWLAQRGLTQLGKTLWQLSPAALVEEAIRNGEGLLADPGALVCHTGKLTGRAPQDKFIVQDDETQATVWWGAINQPFDPDKFDALYKKVIQYLQGKQVYIRDAYAGALPAYQLCLRIINTQAWHNLFCHNLFLRPTQAELSCFLPEWTIIHVPTFQATPAIDGTKHTNFTIINFTTKIILIGGTGYAGEIKKSVFTVLNYLLPQKHQVLPIHCAATVGRGGDTAVYLGLSGTGKTTLSADPHRSLIGDDEHGWDDEGIFNLEGGCYAKTINLAQDQEPQIFNAIKFGAILENVCFVPNTRMVDYANASITENTRSAYPIEHLPNATIPSVGGIPKHIFFLTCDAYGVLPPIAKLSKEQAMYYFITGYTAKVAGTEAGIAAPQTIFSACFGLAFLPLHPTRYAKMLGDKLAAHKATVWLVNTGWIGGPYSIGTRIQLAYTRAMVAAALSGTLAQVAYVKHPVLGIAIPTACPEVPSQLLDPASLWADPAAYEVAVRSLAREFEAAFASYQRFTPN